jgi:prepilin-type processing-associated H-X9-DG protein
MAVVGDGAAWPSPEPLVLAAIADGTSQTILMTEAIRPDVHWMEPRDLPSRDFNFRVNPPQEQPPGLSSRHTDAAHALLADGSVRAILQSVPPETLRALLTPAGGEDVSEF